MHIDTAAAHPVRRAPTPSRWERFSTPAPAPVHAPVQVSWPALSLSRGAGQRRSTPALRHAQALADAWAGLPEGVTRWRLVAALRAAARLLDLSSPMLRLIEHYVDLTYDQDWADDSEPVICRPLVEIAEHMGRSERQVRNIERALMERGLLAFRDSGNHARRGRRDRRTNKLVYAYGPSLAPLAARCVEIIALAATARAQIAKGRRLRLAISALRRRVRADLDAAETAGLDVTALRTMLAATPERLPANTSLDALGAARTTLDALASKVLEQLGGVYPEADAEAKQRSTHKKHPEITGCAETDAPSYTDTLNKYAASGFGIAMKKTEAETSCIAAQLIENDKTNEHDPGSKGAEPTPIKRSPSDHGVSAIPLVVALAAAGHEISGMASAKAGSGASPTWPSLIDAARMAIPLLGIDQTLWGEACARLGRGGAALAAIILERGATRAPDDGAQIRNPAAYLRELLARADRSELRLDRSIRALAARPCHVAK